VQRSGIEHVADCYLGARRSEITGGGLVGVSHEDADVPSGGEEVTRSGAALLAGGSGHDYRMRHAHRVLLPADGRLGAIRQWAWYHVSPT